MPAGGADRRHAPALDPRRGDGRRHRHRGPDRHPAGADVGLGVDDGDGRLLQRRRDRGRDAHAVAAAHHRRRRRTRSAPDADPRRGRLRGGALRLRPPDAGARRLHAARPPRRAGGAGRPLGGGQDHRGVAAAAALRGRGRADPARRRRHPRPDPGRAARPDRHGPAGDGDVQPLGARQHPLRPARRHRGGGPRGGAARRGARLHPRPARLQGPRPATTPISASAASSSPAASASASRWPG